MAPHGIGLTWHPSTTRWRRVREGFLSATAGTTTVEFAIVSLAMLTLLFGSMEFSRAFWTSQILQEVVTEGARCVAIQASSCSSGGTYNATAANNFIVTLAKSRGLTVPSAEITITRPATCATTAGFSSVTIGYTFSTPLAALVPSLGTVPLRATACYYNNVG